jgi:hypothetical protein
MLREQLRIKTPTVAAALPAARPPLCHSELSGGCNAADNSWRRQAFHL